MSIKKKTKWILGFIFMVLVVLVILLIIFPPHRITNGCGDGPCDSWRQCDGLYIETFDETAHDGKRGGWCFGKVIQYAV